MGYSAEKEGEQVADKGVLKPGKRANFLLESAALRAIDSGNQTGPTGS